MANIKDLSEIYRLLEMYFDGFYHADVSLLSDVFHPDARYINMVESEYINTSVAKYIKMIEMRVSPEERGDNRNDKIISIEFGGDKMAFAQVSLSMLGRDYLDYLTLSHDKHGWKIMVKVFHYQTFDESKEPRNNEQEWIER